jgi:hypothetical protein
MAVDPGTTGLAVVVVRQWANGAKHVAHAERGDYTQHDCDWYITHFADLARTYNVNRTLVENAVDGMDIAQRLAKLGVTTQLKPTWKADGQLNSVGNYIAVCRACLARRELHFDSDELRRGLAGYNPDLAGSKSQVEKHKAHVVDALLIGLWELCGGAGYLSQGNSDKPKGVELL